MNSRFQLHEFTISTSRIQLHKFTNSTSQIQLHKFTNLTSRIHEFNFMNSTSGIQLLNSWSWIREFVKLKLWIPEVEIMNSWSWNLELMKLKCHYWSLVHYSQPTFHCNQPLLTLPASRCLINSRATFMVGKMPKKMFPSCRTMLLGTWIGLKKQMQRFLGRG